MQPKARMILAAVVGSGFSRDAFRWPWKKCIAAKAASYTVAECHQRIRLIVIGSRSFRMRFSRLSPLGGDPFRHEPHGTTSMVKQSLRNNLLCFALSVLCLPGIALTGSSAASEVEELAVSGQMILVVTPDWNSSKAKLRRFVRHDGQWQALSAAQPVVIGKSGSAWGLGVHSPQPGLQKREGDGRAPAGIFTLGPAFGYAKSLSTALEYQAMTEQDYCIDVSGSPLYNQIVDAGKVGQEAIVGSTEPMRRDLHAGGDQRYKLGFVIEHNAQHTPAGGSCIFAHLWKSADSSTAGCTAMTEPIMLELLGWLNPAKHPLFVLLPSAEYERLHKAWQLPDFNMEAPR